MLIEFDATSGLTERVAWVEGGGNIFKRDLLFFRPLENNKFFHVDMAGAFRGLLGIGHLSCSAVVNSNLGWEYLFDLNFFQDGSPLRPAAGSFIGRINSGWGPTSGLLFLRIHLRICAGSTVTCQKRTNLGPRRTEFLLSVTLE